MKKTIAILLSLVMLLSCASLLSVSAATETAAVTVAGAKQLVNVGDTLTYTIKLKTDSPIVNGQFYLHYPQSILTIKEVHFPVVGDDTMMANYTEDSADLLSFNFSGTNKVDFTNGGELAVVTYEVTASGSGTLVLEKVAMSSLTANYILEDELDTAVFTETLTGSTYKEPTTLSIKAAKTSIVYQATTTVKATVKNGVGSTKYSSSNTKVAKVDSKSGKVTATGVGSVKIYATNNGVKKYVTIKVTQADNGIKVTSKTVSAKAKANVTVKKAKAFTVKSATGTVTFKKTKGDSKITVKSNGDVVVKKGLKKGKTYSVNVSVTAKGNTNIKKKTVKTVLKVKVK